MLDNTLSIILSAIISFIFTTTILVNVIDEKYGFIMENTLKEIVILITIHGIIVVLLIIMALVNGIKTEN